MTSDPEWIERARRGDDAAFRALFETHVGRVHALSMRLMTDVTEAEDLTQDVFVAAWRQIGTFRGDARFSTWLHGITVRLSRQRFRSLFRRRSYEAGFARGYVDAVAVAMPTANVDLERALASLPRRMRTALVLHAVEGYTHAETAAMMNIAEGTVKAHVHRARALLHERMNRDG